MKGKYIGSYIKAERHRLGWTQHQMAEIGGVSKSSQVGYEAGARVPDMNYLAKVAKQGADVVYLVLGDRQLHSDAPSFNWNAHDQILRAIDEWLQSRRLSLPFEKRMRLLRLFMAHFEVTNRIDLEYVHAELRKAA